MDREELLEIKEKLLPFLVSECGRHNISRVYFMLTNIMDESQNFFTMGTEAERWQSSLFIRRLRTEPST